MPPKHLRVAVPVSFAGLGAVYYGISMLSLANGNMTTALAVASNVEFLPAVAAMSLRAAPSLVLPLVLYGIYRIAKYQTDEVEGQIVIVLAVLAALVAMFYSSVLVLGICLLLLVLHLVHLRSYKKNWKRKFDRGRFDPELARVLMVSIIMTSVIWGPSWLVRETTSIGDKSTSSRS